MALLACPRCYWQVGSATQQRIHEAPRVQRSNGLAFEIFHLTIFVLRHQHVFRPAYLAQDQPDWYSRNKSADDTAARHRVVHVTGHQSFYVDSSPDIDKVGFDPFSEKKTSLPGDLRNQEAGERPAWVADHDLFDRSGRRIETKRNR